MFLMKSVQVPQTKMQTAVPRGARTQVFFSSFFSSSFFFFFFVPFSFFLFLFFSFSFRFSTEGPDADIPPYADILSISGSGSDDEDATDVQKLDAAQPDKPEICF